MTCSDFDSDVLNAQINQVKRKSVQQSLFPDSAAPGPRYVNHWSCREGLLLFFELSVDDVVTSRRSGFRDACLAARSRVELLGD